MFTILKKMAALGLTLSGFAVATLSSDVLAESKPIADRDLAAWVNKRIQDWQIKPEERAFDAIGWSGDIREAERLARQHHRPIFLFTHDGRMRIGRC